MGDEKYVSDKMRPDGPSETAVLWFAGAMLEKLRKNARKRHWNSLPVDEALVRLRQESVELNHACRVAYLGTQATRDEYAHIIQEAADVANFAMFIADNARCAAGIEDVNPWAEHNAFLERSAKYEHGMCEEMERLVRRLARALKDAVRCLERYIHADATGLDRKEADEAIREGAHVMCGISGGGDSDDAWHLNQAVMH